MLEMACVPYPEGRPIINKREINIKKQGSAAWQSSVIFEGLMECSWLREQKRKNKKEREDKKEKAINEESTNSIRESEYNNKRRKTPRIPLLIRSTTQKNNPYHHNVVMYRAPPCVCLQHPVTLIYLLVLQEKTTNAVLH